MVAGVIVLVILILTGEPIGMTRVVEMILERAGEAAADTIES
jgi:hypothetical protein